MKNSFFDNKAAKKARKDAGLTQQQIADALEKDRVTIARFETGIAFSLGLLIEYATYLGKDYKEFLLSNKQENIKNFSVAL